MPGRHGALPKGARLRRAAGRAWAPGLLGVLALAWGSSPRTEGGSNAFAGTAVHRGPTGCRSRLGGCEDVAGWKRGSRTAREAAKKSSKADGVMQTAQAPFMTVGANPLILSPDGTRSARIDVDAESLLVVIEPAPAFGSASNVRAAATARNQKDALAVIPRADLGRRGVRDMFWLSNSLIMCTGYEPDPQNPSSNLYVAWVLDYLSGEAKSVSLPSTNGVSLFVPLGLDDQPTTRPSLDDVGMEVLLCFKSEVNGTMENTWAWYHVGTEDLSDAAVYEGLPSNLWREAVVGDTGMVDALVLWNGTTLRRSPDGWLPMGTLRTALGKSKEEVLRSTLSTLRRYHIVGLGSDFSLYAIDTLTDSSPLPKVTPPLEDLKEGGIAVPEGDSGGDADTVKSLLLAGESGTQTDLDGWVLRQCKERGVNALVHITSDTSAPAPVFAHPFADISAVNVWMDAQTGVPEVVTVDDLRPRAYGLSEEGQKLLKSLEGALPKVIDLESTRLKGEELLPVSAEKHGDRWLVGYWHRMIDQSVALPVTVEAGEATWIGTKALRARGSVLDVASLMLRPRAEAFRLQVGPFEDVPIYLLLPKSADPAALVVRLQTEPEEERDHWGSNSRDAWLLSRGYGVLKVCYRGSFGFGSRWRQPSEAASDDIVAAVRWAIEERRAVAGADSREGPLPVAIMGGGSGGETALRALLENRDLFVCGILTGPALDPAWVSQNAQDIKDASLLLLEFEGDTQERKGVMMQQLVPSGSDPSDWPGDVQYVQYANEARGGGTVRQNMLDQWRRVDAFLYRHLRGRRSQDASPLSREPYVDELPLYSGLLLPRQATGALGKEARTLEGIFKELYEKDNPFAPSLPVLEQEAGKAGFGSSAKSKKGKRSGLVAPASQVFVTEEGNLEITLSFPEAPRELHVLLSQVFLHVRAEGLGFTLTLPRKPIPDKEMRVERLNGNSWLIEIEAFGEIGALRNRQSFSDPGQYTILGVLRPADLENAPLAAIIA